MEKHTKSYWEYQEALDTIFNPYTLADTSQVTISKDLFEQLTRAHRVLSALREYIPTELLARVEAAQR